MFGCFNGWLSLVRVIVAALSLLIVSACSSPEERSQSHYERGLELLKENKHVKAGLEFRNALKLRPEFVLALYELAKVEERKRKWRGVASILTKVIELEPSHLEAHIKLGKLYLLGGNNNKALKYSNTAQNLIKNASKVVDIKIKAESLALRATTLFKLDDKEGAMRDARKALELDTDNVDARIVLVAERLAAEDQIEALALLNKGLERNERNVSLQVLKIDLLNSLKKKEEAEVVFRKIIELYPDTIVFRQALARFYLKWDRNEDAEKELRAIAASHPKDSAAGLAVVGFLNATKGFEAARKELIVQINKGNDIFPYQLALSRLYFSKGKNEEASRILQDVIAANGEYETTTTAEVELAKYMLAAKRRDKAEELVEAVLEKDKRNIEGLIVRATLRKGKGDWDGAIADLRTVLNERPQSARILLLIAEVHELNEAVDLADERLAVAVRVSNYEPRIGLRYVQFLLRRGLLERAEGILQDILLRRPHQREVLATLANVRLRQNNWLGAEEVAATLRELGDENKDISDQVLAAALSGQKKYDESIKLLQSAYGKTPTAIQPSITLFNTFLRAGKLDDAEVFVRNLLDANPKNAVAYVLLGTLYLQQGRRNDAEASFRRAMSVRPGQGAGYRALSSLFAREKKYQEAERVQREGLTNLEKAHEGLSQGLEKRNNRRQSLLLRAALAGLLELAGRFEDAIKEYEILLNEQPVSPIFSNNLASLLADYRDDEASLERAHTLAERFKNTRVPYFKDTLGWIYFRQKQYEPAALMLKEARDGAPKVPLIHYHLGKTYNALNLKELAKEELEKALELFKDTNFPQRSDAEKVLKQLKSSVN